MTSVTGQAVRLRKRDGGPKYQLESGLESGPKSGFISGCAQMWSIWRLWSMWRPSCRVVHP